MMDKMAFLLFGDQSLDVYEFLEDFCRDGNPSVLTHAFLKQVATALRDEVDQLSSLERLRVPRFTSIQELNKNYHNASTKSSAVDSALLCITQLAHYIDRSEKMPEDSTIPSDTCLVGFGTGLFAAAAVTSAPSLSGLVPIGVQVVLMAFRAGAYVASLANHLHRDSGSSESWTYVLPSVGEAAARSTISDFHRENGISLANHAYISAITPNSVAVSGPPATLNALFGSDAFDTRPTAVSIHGPYHAPHLYSDVNAERVMRLGDSKIQKLLGNSKPRFPIMSCTAGAWYSEKSSLLLIEAIFRDILTEPLRFQKIVDGCIAKGQNYRGAKCLVIPFGPINSASSFATILREQTDLEIVLRRATPTELKDSPSTNEAAGRCKLAIVGMAGRFPDAASHEKLWELLEKGLDVHREVPKDRFDVKTHIDPSGKIRNTSHTPFGCWIENPGLFDPRFFNMSPREAFQTDPMQRLSLVTAYEALEMAGYIPNRTRTTKLDRIGTFYGQTSDDWREINAAQDVDTYFITGGVRAFGPGRINYHFGFSGPSFSIDTACSSSAAAIQLACTSLWAGDCDTAVVGGVSCMTNSDIFAGLSRGQFLSKKGPCATFDNDADGYCRADAVGSVIIKRLDDALAEKDNVLAVILGSATNHSADAISITHPHGGTQEILYKSILDKAGIDPLDIDYVEMHGTGTQAGDGTEMKSVTNVFAPANRKRSAEQPLYLGAVKANVGHGEAASGVTALIKVLMMLQKNAIPPHVGIKNTINKGFPKDLSERNVHIAFHKTPLRKKVGMPRRIFVNNFSAAGGNTGLLLEEAPPLLRKVVDPRSTHIVAITAKSKSAMLRNAERLLAYLEQNPSTSVADLAYTTTARRIQHNWRMTITGSDLAQVQAGIKTKLTETFIPVLPEAPKVAFLFTGQGSHYASMGKELYTNSTLFRDSIIEFDRIAAILGFPSFLPLIDGSVTDVSTLSPIVTQLGIVCFEMAMARVWASWGIKPSVVLGHSLGEYSALNVSGILSVSDTIYLVGARAQLLLERCTPGTHIMVATQGSVSAITDALRDRPSPVNIACVNGTRETVLSGSVAEMSDVVDSLNQSGIKCTQLKVPFAFHSAQVDPILDQFQKLAESVHFGSEKVPLISSVLGRLLNEPETIDAEYLRNHARQPVNFLGGLLASQNAGVIDEKTVWLEVGPHPVCLGMVKSTLEIATIRTPTLRRGESAYKTICDSLSVMHTAGVSIDWNEYHRDFNDSVQLLDLPAYSFDDKNYWIQYEGDWCLTKGRLPTGEAARALEPPKPKLSTTSVHKIMSEVIEGDIATVSIESDLSEAKLRGIVSGHVVNGTFLCPSSLYADMAMTLCDYAYKLVRPDATDLGIDVANMKVGKSLVATPEGSSQLLKLTATVNAKANRAELVFFSGTEKNKTEHATCTVYFGARQNYLSEFQRAAYLIQSRMDWLKDAEQEGKAHKIGRGLAYKLFAALVDYDPKFRGMEEVILHSTNMEATARVVFQTGDDDGKFMFSPYWIDSVCHISGFILNGSDATDSKECVYISHGWETFRFAEKLTAEKAYRSYVRMQTTEPNVMAGDVYVFDEDRIVGLVTGLKFQRIPRKVLNMVMPIPGASAAKATPPRRNAPAAKPIAAKKSKTAQVSMETIATVNTKLMVSVCSKALDILAAEVGVGIDELVDNIAFSDLGVDSLMSLTVSGRMREELEIDVHSHDFNDHPTIGAFKTFLAKFETEAPVAVSSSSRNSSVTSLSQATPDLLDDSNVTTPLVEAEETGEENLGDLIRITIAEEMGVDTEEIADTVDLSSLGMDSLMSLTILGRLREKTDLSLPSDLLTNNLSIRDIKKSLNIDEPKKPAAPAPAQKPKGAVVAPPSQNITGGSQQISSLPQRTASSVLLQGTLRKATKLLWLVPDGGGSPTSYTDIPDLASDIAVLGLQSPYMKTPEEYKCGVIGMAEHFIKEIKRRQPAGPYLLAGWSAGGVIAFEAVNQLIKSGDSVEKLILIDSPCPDIIEPLPSSLHRWFGSIGLLGDGDESKLPSWLLPHFAASVNALSTYSAEVIDPQKCPQVTAIWCEDGVCKLPTDPRPDPFPYGHAQFLLDNRTDFGPNIWDKYLNPKKFESKHMPGNHFTMMKKPYVGNLGDIIREAVLKTV